MRLRSSTMAIAGEGVVAKLGRKLNLCRVNTLVRMGRMNGRGKQWEWGTGEVGLRLDEDEDVSGALTREPL